MKEEILKKQMEQYEMKPEWVDIIFRELERKAECIKSNILFVPESSADAFVLFNREKKEFTDEFNLNRFLKFRKDFVECKNLRIQNMYFLNYRNSERKVIFELLKIYNSLEGNNNFNLKVKESNKELNKDSNKESNNELNKSARFSETILALIRRKELNLEIVEKCMENIAFVFKAGEELAIEIGEIYKNSKK